MTDDTVHWFKPLPYTGSLFFKLHCIPLYLAVISAITILASGGAVTMTTFKLEPEDEYILNWVLNDNPILAAV